MVVDDDMQELELWEYVADASDTIISIRKGGLSALEWLGRVNYEVDAVIMDLSMPDMDGITLSRQIRRHEDIRSMGRPIKLFWFTGWDFDPENPNDTIVLAQKECGVSRVWRKPQNMAKLIDEVKEALWT